MVSCIDLQRSIPEKQIFYLVFDKYKFEIFISGDKLFLN